MTGLTASPLIMKEKIERVFQSPPHAWFPYESPAERRALWATHAANGSYSGQILKLLTLKCAYFITLREATFYPAQVPVSLKRAATDLEVVLLSPNPSLSAPRCQSRCRIVRSVCLTAHVRPRPPTGKNRKEEKLFYVSSRVLCIHTDRTAYVGDLRQALLPRRRA
jgi:hypothetical protein